MITCKFPSGYESNLRHVVVDALIISDDKILLCKRAADKTYEPGKYCLPGGYVDLDETISEAMVREILEETGYKSEVETLFWINDDPNRVDVQSVTFVYLVKIIKNVQEPDCETESIHWFDLDDLPSRKEMAFDHAEIIKLYLKWRKKKFQLPIVGESNQ